jgi:Uma2 family endonuclease
MVADALRWTTRNLQAMPDHGGWKRYEIIDGELFVTLAPHFRHQSVAGKLQVRLQLWSEVTGLGEAVQVPRLVFTPNDAVIPDLIWASQSCLQTGLDESGHFTTAPELVVEILSVGEQNQQRDREVKLKLYSRFGVQEYWIIDWQRQCLEVYRREKAQLTLINTLLKTDTLVSPLLPGFSLYLAKIL